MEIWDTRESGFLDSEIKEIFLNLGNLKFETSKICEVLESRNLKIRISDIQDSKNMGTKKIENWENFENFGFQNCFLNLGKMVI